MRNRKETPRPEERPQGRVSKGGGKNAMLPSMETLLVTHPACLGHETPPGHPECPDRLRAVLDALEA